MKNWSDGVVESWSVGIIRLKALLQYSNTPTKRILCLTLCVILFALCFPVDAQQAKKVPRIGFLEGATVAESQGIEPFRQGLRELGYVEGQNIIVEIRALEGKPDRIPDLIAELLRSKVDVIFTPTTAAAAQAAKKAAPTIPIVVVLGDPLGSGLVTSLARPGGNVTGLSGFLELGGKRLEILKDTLPSLNRVAVFWTSTNAPMEVQFKETETAARVLGIKLQALEVRGPEDFHSASKAQSGSALAL